TARRAVVPPHEAMQAPEPRRIGTALVRILNGHRAVGTLDAEHRVEGVPRHVGKEAKPGELESGQHLEEIEALGEAEAARVPWIRGSVAALIGRGHGQAFPSRSSTSPVIMMLRMDRGKRPSQPRRMA